MSEMSLKLNCSLISYLPGNSCSIQRDNIPLTKDRKETTTEDKPEDSDRTGAECQCLPGRVNRRFLLQIFIFVSLLNFLVLLYIQPLLLEINFSIPLTENLNIIVNKVVKSEHATRFVYTEDDFRDGEPPVMRRPNIPHILHQTWRDEKIPSKFVPFLLTWARTQPHWQIWMWSDEDNEKFVKKCYPDLYNQYKDYGQKIHRLHVMRYLILHQFGGVYADIDTKSIRSMDNLTYIHNFILPKEPPEHAILLWDKPSLAGNAVLASRPRHPFIDFVLEKLSDNAKIGTDFEVSAKTGTDMLDRMIALYSKRTGTAHWNETVYYADSSYFLPTFAEYSKPILRRVCEQQISSTEINHYRVCNRLKKTSFQNLVPPQAYTIHRWLWQHSLMKHTEDYITNYSDLKERAYRSKDVSKIINGIKFDKKTRRCRLQKS
jgi:mannosyltransferase OCH1-like enzyme